MDNNVLTAREGYVYTNGETFASVVRLGINDSADNWHEITDEEYMALHENMVDESTL